MSVKLLTEQHLVFLSLKGDCIGWSESTLVKIPHCWKSHVMAQLLWSIRTKRTDVNIHLNHTERVYMSYIFLIYIKLLEFHYVTVTNSYTCVDPAADRGSGPFPEK